MSIPLTKAISFRNRAGHELSARLEFPADGHARAFILFAHCFTCGKDLKVIRNISRSMTSAGFGVMVFDFTGLGSSGGTFADTGFYSNVEDLVDAAAYLRENDYPLSILIGHSLGGAAALCAASNIDEVQAVATIGAPFDPDHVLKLMSENLETIRKAGHGEVQIAEKSFVVGSRLLEELDSGDFRVNFKKLNKALLVLHSPQDEVVDIDNARMIFQEAMHPKSFISLDGADHLLTREADAHYAGHVIAAWCTRYIKMKDRDLRTEQQVVAVIGKEKYITQIQAGEHYLMADEPMDMNGRDLGPSPYGLLMAALGSCTAMTLRMYADLKGIDLRKVRVHLSHSKAHAEDSASSKKIDRITREIELEGDLESKMRERLLQIANRCPVHKTLNDPVEVISSLLE